MNALCCLHVCRIPHTHSSCRQQSCVSSLDTPATHSPLEGAGYDLMVFLPSQATLQQCDQLTVVCWYKYKCGCLESCTDRAAYPSQASTSYDPQTLYSCETVAQPQDPCPTLKVPLSTVCPGCSRCRPILYRISTLAHLVDSTVHEHVHDITPAGTPPPLPHPTFTTPAAQPPASTHPHPTS